MAIPIERKGLRKGERVVAGSPGGGREWVRSSWKAKSGKEQRKVKAREEQVTGKELKGPLKLFFVLYFTEDGWALWVCAEVGPGGSGITRVPFLSQYFPLPFYFMSCFS